MKVDRMQGLGFRAGVYRDPPVSYRFAISCCFGWDGGNLGHPKLLRS